MKYRLFRLWFFASVLISVIIISKTYLRFGNERSSKKKWNLKKIETKPFSRERKSVNLSDGMYWYYLNLSQFQAEFPFLQSYQCSLTLTPNERFQDRLNRSLLILAIKSHPESGTRRAALRQTWARESEVNGFWVKPIFLLAQDAHPVHTELLQIESREFGDILQWDFSESHHNLSLKERCFLEWLYHQVPWVTFIFKGDDDEYVNPYAVVQYIKEHGSSPSSLHGNVQRHGSVMRSNKYCISESLYPFHIYPAFVSGGGFLFPGSSVKILYEISQKIPVFPLDDVYFGFLGLAANLSYRHDYRFHVSGLTFEICRYQRALVVHGIVLEEMVTIFNKMKNEPCKT